MFVFELLKLLLRNAEETSVAPPVDQVAGQQVIMGDGQQGVGAHVAVDEEQLDALLLQLLVGRGKLLLVRGVEVELAANQRVDVVQLVLCLWCSNHLGLQEN